MVGQAVPGTPEAPEVRAQGQRLTVHFEPPDDEGSTRLTSLDVRYRTGTGPWITLAQLDVTRRSIAITGLAANTAYEVQVRGVNSVGNGPWSEHGAAITGGPLLPSADRAAVKADYYVELAMADGIDPGLWTDITADVYCGADGGVITWRCGRDDILSAVQPGSAQFQVNNPDGKYSAANEDSPLYGHVREMRAVRLTAEYGACDAWHLNGTNAGGTIAGALDLSATDWTLDLWCHPASTLPVSGTRVLLHLQGTVTVSLNGSGVLAVRRGNAETLSTPSGTVPTDVGWVHLVITYAESSRTVTLYVNGVDEWDDDFSAALVAGTGNGWLGYNGQTDADHWTGLLQEIRLYTRVLSEADITRHYNAGQGRYGWITEAALAAAWHLNEGSGNSAKDYSGNNHALSLGGTVAWTDGHIRQGWRVFYGPIYTLTPDIQEDAPRVTVDLIDNLEWLRLNDDIEVTFANARSGAHIETVLDAADWPARLRMINNGQSTFQPEGLTGSAQAQIESIVANDAGVWVGCSDGRAQFQDRHYRLLPPHTTSLATFTVTSGITALALPRQASDIFNRVTLPHAGDGEVTAEDEDSIARFGRRTPQGGNLRADFLPELEAQDRAMWAIREGKEPQERLMITVDGTESAAQLAHVLELEISSRVTVLDTVRNTGIDGDKIVESIEGTIAHGGLQHDVVLQLSRADLSSGYFVWGRSRWGVDTRFAY